MAKVTVVIPVGPYPSNQKWLDECIESVFSQTKRVDDILLIDDQANLKFAYSYSLDEVGVLSLGSKEFIGIRVWKTPWLVGIPDAFNFGIALAKNELVVMLGSDDWLEPTAIEKLVETYEKNKQKDAYYAYTIKYSDDDEIQDQPCNCAAVTKGLWKLTGGFPPESAVGACDSIFISMMIKHHRDKLIPVAQGHPLYNYRRHNETDTGTRSVAYQGVIHVVRDIYTTDWKKPIWT